MIQRGSRLMDRLKNLEIGAKLAMKRNDETQLRQIARDRVVVKDGLKELVRKIEAQREFAEALEKVLDDECDGKRTGRASYLPYETEDGVRFSLPPPLRSAFSEIDWFLCSLPSSISSSSLLDSDTEEERNEDAVPG